MRIDRVRLHPVRITRETGVANDHVIVAIETDDGVVGWGEMSDLSHLPLYQFDLAQLQSALTEILVGADPRELNQIERRMTGFYPDEGHMYSRSGLVRQGVELAHLRLPRSRGRGAGQRACWAAPCAIASPSATRCSACARPTRCRPRSTASRRSAARGSTSSGFYAGTDHAADLAFMSGFADRFAGRVRIKSLDFSNVLGMARGPAGNRASDRCRGRDAGREPRPARRSSRGSSSSGAGAALPVSEHVHGQRHAWQLLHLGAVDILNLSPYVLGGIRPTIRAAAMAEAAGASVLLGTTQELGLGTAAVAHVGAVLPALPFPADNVGPRLYTADVATPPVEFVDGQLVVPTGPGLGPTVDRSLLESLRSNGDWSFGLDLAGAVDRTLPPAS